MTKRWRIHDEALDEVEGTIDWYEEQRAALGLEFFAELRNTLATLREHPAVSTPDRSSLPDAPIRRRRLHRFPYAVVFVETDAEYVVVAVMHLRRKPGYWLARLRR
jgi:toxin ParE1/3/4